MSSETVYAIASGKGGVGKTTTTVNLGTALARAGERVAVVDADLGMANLAGFVGLNPDSTTLSDVLSERASVDDATYRLAENIVAVPSGTDLDDYAETAPEQLRDVVDELRSQYDAVLLDVGAGITHETVLPLGLADAVVVVSTPEPAAVHDSTKTLELTERAGGEAAGLVLTRTRPETDVSYEEIADRLDLPLLGTIPEDPAARESVYAGTPLVVHAPDSPASAAYRRIAADLAGIDVPNDRPDDGSESDDRSDAPPAGAQNADADPDANRDSEAEQDDVSSAITEAESER
ncbi:MULTISPECIES: cell division ATPase MinD [Natrialbaceae]|uniref:cell division ATPase MinD n=1 Tax=Natrialbaceae TaxID=1644061 RepID=UPI00207C5775|nr:cell division ATPase MinD [Natronococcus sp. CG52]